MSDWKTKSSDVVYETPWIKVRRDEVLNQHGDPLTYSYMELQNPSVFIVAVNGADEIFLQRVYRHPVKNHFWEIPAGFIGNGENPLDAAKRELKEEAGLTSDDWHSLGRIYQITGTGNVPLEVFLARNVQQDGDATDENEDIQDRHFKSPAAIEAMIASSELIDSPVIAALYMANIHGLQKEEQ